ncbi:S1/P1 nuclease [Legionella impletisoli]|uniref:Nuclease n=1 Tax=Legionella impletisoli TaxID=343510 RepID=A0A917JMS7_9GAMM|nr:S1/P1 nuclease [Legionella impletisoli]GGI76958.1 nuclease [Legionella impletisoli]
MGTIRFLGGIILLLSTMTFSYAWNSVGHRIIAQIAYNHLSKGAKRDFNHLIHSMDREYRPQTFVNASVWLDGLRAQDVNWYNTFHYIDWFFSEDSSPLPSTQQINALWAMQQAIKTLKSNKASDFDKGLSLRILIHVAGDIHQPLHAASRVSHQHPAGDLGGNLVELGKNEVGNNLHQYWDKGAGFLSGQRHYNRQQIIELANRIEQQFPCNPKRMDLSPEHWAKESHQFAKNFSYNLKPCTVPKQAYQDRAIQISKERIALAGCRLAAMLNEIDLNLKKPSY